MLDVYNQAEIPHGINPAVRIWAAPRKHVLKLNGYDELYCLGSGYEHCDLAIRIARKIKIFNRQNNNFCGIHLWHSKEHKEGVDEKINERRLIQSNPDRVVNNGWQWGKLLKYSFSIIDGKAYSPANHERWIYKHIDDVPAYIGSPQWVSLDRLIRKLKNV
jgi:hypothetical protein